MKIYTWINIYAILMLSIWLFGFSFYLTEKYQTMFLWDGIFGTMIILLSYNNLKRNQKNKIS